MNDMMLFAPIIIIAVIAFVAVPLVNMFKNTFGENSAPQKTARDVKYLRQVDSIHVTRDAAAERKHRLDQLKSLYQAGMMEKDEYNERVAAVEEDYRGRC